MTHSLDVTEQLGVPAHLAVPAEGRGPGLILIGDDRLDDAWLAGMAKLMAEEGYLSLALRLSSAPAASSDIHLKSAMDVLQGHAALDGAIGLVDYSAGAGPGYAAACSARAACVVLYDVPVGQGAVAVPMQVHIAEQAANEDALETLRANPQVAVHVYPKTTRDFFCDDAPGYVQPAAMIAYSRMLGLLRRIIGPQIDLEKLWDTHLYHEFITKDPVATINTMVPDCYVNHIPNMTGGTGRAYLFRFYKHHFIPKTPDVEMIPISRTVGTDRIVDEFVASFVHDREIDWLLPGIAPTGRRVFVPTVSIVCFRGRKLYHEHIYWDQASVLVQIGLLDPAGLPVAGAEIAQKVLDPQRPSNTLMTAWNRSEQLDNAIGPPTS